MSGKKNPLYAKMPPSLQKLRQQSATHKRDQDRADFKKRVLSKPVLDRG